MIRQTEVIIGAEHQDITTGAGDPGCLAAADEPGSPHQSAAADLFKLFLYSSVHDRPSW
jgi:hypothetical protein